MIGVKHHWTESEEHFLLENFDSLTNADIAKRLGLTLTLVRMKCYSMGLKRMEMEYWTEEQVDMLYDIYKTMGDREISRLFADKWPKAKGWSHKHIEKKRRYLNLKRTEEQKQLIKERNIEMGCFSICPVKAWDKRGRAAEGTIRFWRQRQSNREFPVIKVKGKFVHWARWKWEVTHGPVQKGMNVIFVDGDPRNLTIENLALMDDAGVAQRNVAMSSKGLSDNYIAGILSLKNPAIRPYIKQNKELIDLKRQQLLLNRAINERTDNSDSGANDQ